MSIFGVVAPQFEFGDRQRVLGAGLDRIKKTVAALHPVVRVTTRFEIYRERVPSAIASPLLHHDTAVLSAMRQQDTSCKAHFVTVNMTSCFSCDLNALSVLTVF